jgi:hypothetical protein
MWTTTLGGTPINSDIQLSGLDATATYDLYLYYVNPESSDPATTTYSITTGFAPTPSATLTSTQSTVFVEGTYTNFDNYVENGDYVVITGISPSSGGIIGLNVSATTGGLSAMQLVKRGTQIQIPVPNINTFVQSGNSALLGWGTSNSLYYTVLGTTNLVNGSWTEVTNGIQGTGADAVIDLPMTSHQQFFKIKASLH